MDYRDDLKVYFTERLAGDPLIKPGQMLGHPGFATETNNKLFIMFYDDGILLKLPPERYEEMLARDEVVPFQPMGMKKGMGTWVVWTKVEPEEYGEEWPLILESLHYVAAEPPNPKRKRKKKV